MIEETARRKAQTQLAQTFNFGLDPYFIAVLVKRNRCTRISIEVAPGMVSQADSIAQTIGATIRWSSFRNGHMWGVMEFNLPEGLA